MERQPALCSGTQLEGNTLMNKVETLQEDVAGPASELSPKMDSIALLRLIDEVRTSEPILTGAYNRTYNRHNR